MSAEKPFTGMPPSAAGAVRPEVVEALLCMQRESWEQGVSAQAFLEAGDERRAILLARDAVVRQAPDGRLGQVGAGETVTDPAAAGEAVLFAAASTGEPAYGIAAKRMAEWLLTTKHRTADGVLHHRVDRPSVWVDSLYMAPPFLAAAGYPDEAVRQIEGMRRLLWSPSRNLFHHVWDGEGKGDPAFWGGGNGWAAAGMVRVLGLLRDSHAGARARISDYLNQLISGCLACLRPDGFFHDVMDDPGSFVETNASQMIAYAIYRGMTLGCLPESLREHAERMRAAALSRIDAHGLIQGACGAPAFNAPGTSAEAQAFHILMESARARLDSRQDRGGPE